MKKVVAGIGFEITGVIMVIFASLNAIIGLENTTEWNTELGRYWQTVFDLGMFPIYLLGIVLLIAGVAFSLWGVFSKER